MGFRGSRVRISPARPVKGLPRRHDAAYRRLLDPAGRFPAVCAFHPHARLPSVALAWARLDVDLAAGEALIDEVQSDWIRALGGLWSSAARLEPRASRDRAVQGYFRNPRARFEGLERYWLRVLAHHRAWWAEATLFGALAPLRAAPGAADLLPHLRRGPAPQGHGRRAAALDLHEAPAAVRLRADPGGAAALRTLQEGGSPLRTGEDWARGPHRNVTLTARKQLADLLAHLYVLSPVLDDDKHYWGGDEEVEKLLRIGGGAARGAAPAARRPHADRRRRAPRERRAARARPRLRRGAAAARHDAQDLRESGVHSGPVEDRAAAPAGGLGASSTWRHSSRLAHK